MIYYGKTDAYISRIQKQIKQGTHIPTIYIKGKDGKMYIFKLSDVFYSPFNDRVSFSNGRYIVLIDSFSKIFVSRTSKNMTAPFVEILKPNTHKNGKIVEDCTIKII